MTNLRERFIRALRSGRYKQTHGALAAGRDGSDQEPTRFCAEGLLCHLVNPVWHYSNNFGRSLWLWTSPSGSSYGGLAPFSLITELNLPSGITLHTLNDSRTTSFPQIADVLDPHHLINGDA